MNTHQKITIRSKALYSTWIVDPFRKMILDCGEGVGSFLGNKVDTIRHVVLTHDHIDHTAGLAVFLNTKACGMVAKANEETVIVYPDGSIKIEKMLDCLDLMGRYPFKVVRMPIKPGDEVPLARGNILKAFEVKHCKEPAYGYCVFENRTKLLPEFVDTTNEEKVEAKKKGIAITNSQRLPVVGYSGDTGPFDVPDWLVGVDTFYHEATFMDSRDRKKMEHSDVWEAMGRSLFTINCRKLVLYHLSGRYCGIDYTQEVNDALARARLNGARVEEIELILPFKTNEEPTKSIVAKL